MHLMEIIASGIFDSSGYYIADYGAGAMFVTIKSELAEMAQQDAHLRIFTIFPQLISLFEVNHKNALKSYLIAKDCQVSENNKSIISTKDEKTVTGIFDTADRLTKLE